MSKAEQLSVRLEHLVDKSLLQDLQYSGDIALDMPNSVEATVLHRLAVLETLCVRQAHTIGRLQHEVQRVQEGMSTRKPAPLASLFTQIVSRPSKDSVPQNIANLLQSKLDQHTTIAAVKCDASASGQPSPSAAANRVHTLRDPSTALQPLSREQFVAKLPKVVIKQGQILPIQRCIKALLADAAVLGNPLAASDDNLQQLSARIASVLLYNRDLHIDGTALSTGNSNSIVAHIPRQASAAENNENATILQGTISGPEVFNAMVDHDNQVDGGDAHADSHRAGNPAYSAEEDVGCNGLVHFFLAEMLGGSAA